MATYTPEGPQVSVPTSAVEHNGWGECYRQSMNSYLSDTLIDENIQPSCFGDKVMMTCQKTNCSTIEVLAWANRSDVFLEDFELRDDIECGESGKKKLYGGYYYTKDPAYWNRTVGEWTLDTIMGLGYINRYRSDYPYDDAFGTTNLRSGLSHKGVNKEVTCRQHQCQRGWCIEDVGEDSDIGDGTDKEYFCWQEEGASTSSHPAPPCQACYCRKYG